jgi:hypothetical protein
MPELGGQFAVIMKRKRFDYHGNLAAPADLLGFCDASTQPTALNIAVCG